MTLYWKKQPEWVSSIFPFVLTRKKTDKPTIFLTFDDGPFPETTPFILEELRKRNAKGTFFLLGRQVAQFPELVKDILRDGHAIGNHTYSHLDGWAAAAPFYIGNVIQAEEVISWVADKKPTLFRPPYGHIRPGMIYKLHRRGYQIVGWEVMPGDFDSSVSADKCLENAIRLSEDGSIVVFHENAKSAKKLIEVLPKFLDHFIDQGFSFEGITAKKKPSIL